MLWLFLNGELPFLISIYVLGADWWGRFAKDMEKRGWGLIEVPYENIYNTIGGGIHCSTAAIWRES